MKAAIYGLVLAVAASGCVAAGKDYGGVSPSNEIRLDAFASATEANDRLDALTQHYLAGADRARRSRQNSNGAVAVLNTYTLGSLALGAATNNPLISSLLANLVTQFDGVNNAGGEAPWLAAVSRNTCVAGQLLPARRAESHPELRSDSELSAAYDGALNAATESMTRIYVMYRQSTSQALLAAASGTRPAAQNNAFMGTTPDKAVLIPELKASAIAMRACVAGAQT